MATVKNVKLTLADGADFEYESARVVIENGGVLRVAQGDRTTYYAPGEWKNLEHGGVTAATA